MFKNEPFLDFTISDVRRDFEGALAWVEDRIASGGFISAPRIGGLVRTEGRDILVREDPSRHAITVGKVILATKRDAEEALALVRLGQTAWEETPAVERCAVLRRAADQMRREKYRLSALIIREVGKTWREADADVAEAIDFCEYYAAEMDRLRHPRRTQDVPGEDCFYLYQPRGVCVVISPWNFPLAIACGMVAAALVTGNSVVLKPAEQSSLIAAELARILYEAGTPDTAFAFLPGLGEEVGRCLVESPLVDMICFTGSKAVGLEILSTAGKVHASQRSIKRVVCELGGKNAVIVDEDADLDEAVKGILQSAFGFAGQKCSACSRVIAVGTSFEPLVSRLRDAANDLLVGEARDPSSFFGPVVDADALSRILRTVAAEEYRGTLLFKGKVPAIGHYVPPTIFSGVDLDSPIWREEIFGPVLACVKATSLDEALTIANDSQYALTGGLFSRDPLHIDQVKRRFKVGNLYINRGITGALVERHPFGGFRMSGVGSKAGGPDYLIQFMEPRTISENTMRRGFVPSS